MDSALQLFIRVLFDMNLQRLALEQRMIAEENARIRAALNARCQANQHPLRMPTNGESAEWTRDAPSPAERHLSERRRSIPHRLATG